MPKIYNARNVQEAVEMAAKFKDKGTYSWFRGQTKDWPPYSSIFRLRGQSERIIQAATEYEEFVGWLKQKDGLQYLTESANIHQLEAILQHYGFPTDYIDFSLEPSVAGFFASDTQNPPEDGHSCIYCLDIDDLMEFWKIAKDFDSRKQVTIEKVIINVDNLWRLQAQQGVFLKSNYNWDIDYPMDKIVFPYTGYPPFPPKDQIYPTHKSALEILLDEYFDRRRGQLAVSELVQIFGPPHLIKTFPDGYYMAAFQQPLHHLPSWSADKLSTWRLLPSEEFRQASGFIQRIDLRGKNLAEDVRSAVYYLIKHLQRSNDSVRLRAIEWVIEHPPLSLDAEKAEKQIMLIWNAMRQRPYTAEEIASACANTLYLQMHNFGQLSTKHQLEVFKDMAGDGLRIGFSIREGNGATGFLSIESFNGMISRDIKTLLADDFKSYAGSARSLFSIIYNPSLMFDFDLFRNAFAKEIIPTAVSIGNSFVIFNPAQLMILGNP